MQYTSLSSDLYETELKALLKEGFEERITTILSEYAYMIDRRAAVYIAAHEAGIVKTKKKDIHSFSEISGDESGLSFTARVVKIYLPFESKSHRTMRILVRDELMNEKVLVLWNERVDEVLVSHLERNDLISVKNAYHKNGELHAGTYSIISVNKANKIGKIAELTEGSVNVGVRVLSQPQTRTYTRDNTTKRMLSAWCGDETGKIRIVAWDSIFDNIKSIEQGDVLLIYNAIFRNGEIHLTQYTKIEINPNEVGVCLRPGDVEVGVRSAVCGTLISVFESGDELCGVIRTAERDFKVLFQEQALRKLIGKELSPDISLRIASLIKLNSVLGDPIMVEGRLNENGVYECNSLSIRK